MREGKNLSAVVGTAERSGNVDLAARRVELPYRSETEALKAKSWLSLEEHRELGATLTLLRAQCNGLLDQFRISSRTGSKLWRLYNAVSSLRSELDSVLFRQRPADASMAFYNLDNHQKQTSEGSTFATLLLQLEQSVLPIMDGKVGCERAQKHYLRCQSLLQSLAMREAGGALDQDRLRRRR